MKVKNMKIRKKLIFLLDIIAICVLAACFVYQHITKPKISVVMSTFNRGGVSNSLLERAINSILSQTETDFELIIINDGSTDNTAEILEKYARRDSRIVILTNKTNKGLPYSLNRGLEAARGIYIARMDDDDMSYPTRFEKQVSFLDTHPHITATGCAFTFSVDHPEWAVSFPVDPDESKLWTFIRVPVVHPCAMIRRSFLEKHHIRYVETYPNAEDMPFWYDVTLKHNGLISNLQDVLLLKGINAPKKENYGTVQNESVARYRNDTFESFLKQNKNCGTNCECYTALEKSGTTKDIIRSEAIRRQIEAICPPADAIRIDHPEWQDYFVFESETRGYRYSIRDYATILERTSDKIKVKWDKWGTETFMRQSDGSYIFKKNE